MSFGDKEDGLSAWRATTMERTYCKIVSVPYDAEQDYGQAIAAGAFAKKYFLDDNTIGRVDYFFPHIGICKVSYRQIEPPFDRQLAEHFREYPEDVFCEFILPEGVSPDGLRVEGVYLFKSPADLEQTRNFLDERGWVVRRVFFGRDG